MQNGSNCMDGQQQQKLNKSGCDLCNISSHHSFEICKLITGMPLITKSIPKNKESEVESGEFENKHGYAISDGNS